MVQENKDCVCQDKNTACVNAKYSVGQRKSTALSQHRKLRNKLEYTIIVSNPEIEVQRYPMLYF